MKKLRVYLFGLGLVISSLSFAQSEGVSISPSGAAPHPSAMLDISGTSKGVLINRMTQSERDEISNPAVGLQIFNTTTNCINMWVGNTWKQSCFDCDFQSPTPGNSGPICEGSTLQLSATTIPGATYQWAGPNGFTSSLQNPAIPNATVAASGSYSVTATLNGCTSQAQTTIATVNGTPVTPTASNDGPVCSGSILNLNATTVVGATYAWTGPNGYSASVQNPIITNATASSAGLFQVTATLNGCSSAPGNTTVVVNEIPATPGTISGIDQACPNTADVVYSISPVSGAASYNWTIPAGASITANSGTSITLTYGAVPQGLITVSASNVCGTSSQQILSIQTEAVCSPFTLNATGSGANGTIQTFVVPQGINSITIEATGARGGQQNGNSGRGARMQGTFSVTPGETIKVLVGQRGADLSGAPSGGGGTFVTRSDNTPMIVAGGGGGAGLLFSQSLADASTSTSGNPGYHPSRPGPSAGEAPGGTGGNGGNAGRLTPGGGGFNTNGQTTNADGGASIPGPGLSFLNGGNGGSPATTTACSSNTPAPGGFGGGSGAGYAAAGAGGGYSGGGGTDGCDPGSGGGGGSYNAGTNQVNTAGAGTGDGQVVFTW